jgi:hypothetical protein
MSALKKRSEMLADRPWSVAGMVVVALGVLGLYWLWPEIQRYARIKRM